MPARASIRRLAVLLVAALGFAHASLALAACTMDRSDLSQALAAQDMECCNEEGRPMSVNGCVRHCTSDLQHAGVPAAVVQAPTAVLVFVLPDFSALPPDAARVEERPPGAVPPRILLHSFQI